MSTALDQFLAFSEHDLQQALDWLSAAYDMLMLII